MVEDEKPSGLEALRSSLRRLYHGESKAALRFQLSIIFVDLLTIAFFIVSPVLREWPSFLWLDYTVAAVLAVDITARALASRDILRWLKQLPVLVDIFILVTLLFPYTLFNLGFLRILRLWTIWRSGTIWRTLERRGYGMWRDEVHAVMNLLTFLLLAASFVYVSFYRDGNGLEGYVDALYVTVATVTTTGFGDMVLPGVWGKLTSIVIMIVGITLFVRLARSIFRPFKVYFPCPECALQRHDVDAVFCKACGHKLKIPDEGE
ncbi:MAG: two pore domain potassium channel family protein [Rhizobiales bacterium]|jgi:voltage-gated potassium channel|nr:two pore domain potassium channel family protein [Hyphomicrobiales bacterium]